MPIRIFEKEIMCLKMLRFDKKEWIMKFISQKLSQMFEKNASLNSNPTLNRTFSLKK